MLRGQVGGWGVRTVKRDPCTVDPACPPRNAQESVFHCGRASRSGAWLRVSL